jgi:hypothetical protein
MGDSVRRPLGRRGSASFCSGRVVWPGVEARLSHFTPPPNPRLQRTRVRAPLSRKPLGGGRVSHA